MSRESIVFFLGFLVFITPYLGIPSIWKDKLLGGVGALLMVLGYLIRRTTFFTTHTHTPHERKELTYAESSPRTESESPELEYEQ